MKTLLHIETVIADVDELIERAKLILSNAPYFTSIPEEQYVRLGMDGDMARLVWPESHSGYYDSCSIEEQSKVFPAELLLMSRPEIEFWKVEQRKIYDENQRVEKQRRAQAAAETQRRNELAMLAALKSKYEQQ